MKKSILVAIAKRLAFYDSGNGFFCMGAFSAMLSLLEDFGYSYVRRDGRFDIVDGNGSVICSVKR